MLHIRQFLVQNYTQDRGGEDKGWEFCLLILLLPTPCSLWHRSWDWFQALYCGESRVKPKWSLISCAPMPVYSLIDFRLWCWEAA